MEVSSYIYRVSSVFWVEYKFYRYRDWVWANIMYARLLSTCSGVENNIGTYLRYIIQGIGILCSMSLFMLHHTKVNELPCV